MFGIRGVHRQCMNHCNALSEVPWLAVLESEMIRPSCFEEDSVIEDSYKKMLRYFAFSSFGHYPQSMIFQQNGVPPHFANTVRQRLDTKLCEENGK